MKKYYFFILLIISILYALCFGNRVEKISYKICKTPKYVSSKYDKEDARYFYLYSRIFLGCRIKSDREHYRYLPYFYDTNTAHLLSISGLHIGSITLVVFLLVNLFLYLFVPVFKKGYLPLFYFSLPVGVLVSTLYVVFIGIEIPRLRALLMLILGIFSMYLPVFRNRFNVLFLAASVILLFLPSSIYSYSFYYSFIAVSAILFSVFLSSTKRIIMACLYIYLFLIPLNLHTSGIFDLNHILSNIIIVPFFSLIYFPTQMFLGLIFASGFHDILVPMNIFTDFFIFLLKILSKISSVTRLHTLLLTTAEVLLLYCVLFIFLISIRFSKILTKRRVVYIYISIATVTLIAFFILSNEYKRENRILNFELTTPYRMRGSGDIILIQAEDKVVVVDTGHGKYSTSKVLREIKRMKKGRIDYLILTHTDSDHVGGIEQFLNEPSIGVKNVIVSPLEYNYMRKKKVLSKANFTSVCNGSEIHLGRGSRIVFLSPECRFKRYKNNNKNALSFLLYIDGYTFMFSSDLPYSTLKNIVKNHNIPRGLIYQMAHHCSRRDNPLKLFNKIKPVAGFCTRDKRLLRSGIKYKNFNFPIFSTGLCGDTSFLFKNGGLEVESSRCPKLSLQMNRS